jgi:hypothetical protein
MDSQFSTHGDAMFGSQRNEKGHRKQRKTLFVDKQVQGALVQQAVYHWAWTTLTFGAVIFFSRIAPAVLTGDTSPSGRLWYHLGPFVLATSALFPIIFFSTIRFSNRFAGPMVRVRRTLKQLGEGGVPSTLRFRDGDFWSDLAEDINKISKLAAEKRLAETVSTQAENRPTAVPPAVENPYAPNGNPVAS